MNTSYREIPVREVLKCYGIWDETKANQSVILFCLKDYYGSRRFMKLLHGVS